MGQMYRRHILWLVVVIEEATKSCNGTMVWDLLLGEVGPHSRGLSKGEGAMKRGSIVTVYEDPLTRKVIEGAAIVITVYQGDYDPETKLHLCRVKMVGDDGTVVRRIRTCDVQ